MCTHPISIKCCTKIIVSASHAVHQVCSVGEAGIWALTPEVLQRHTVNSRIGRTTQLLTQNSLHIWSYHWGETVVTAMRGDNTDLPNPLPGVASATLSFSAFGDTLDRFGNLSL